MTRSKLLSKPRSLAALLATFLLLSCGPSISPSQLKIEGGEKVSNSSWDMVVRIERLIGSDWVINCSGTYIGERIVLTAGHCISWNEELYHTIQKPEEISPAERVRISTRAGNVYSVQRVYAEAYNFRSNDSETLIGMLPGYDLALLELSEEPTIPAATLAPPYGETGLQSAEDVYILGYQGSPELTMGEVSLIRHFDLHQSALLLAGSTKICPGDSGGAAFTLSENGYQLIGVHSFQAGVSLISPIIFGCLKKGYTGAVDIRQPGAQSLIERGRQFFRGPETTPPASVFVNPIRLPGRIEAELAGGAVDFSFGNLGQAKAGLHSQTNLDIYQDAESGGLFIGSTEIGESLVYLVKNTLQGPAKLKVRARNIDPTQPGRIFIRFASQHLDVHLKAAQAGWQELEIPLVLAENDKDLRLSIEILSPLDLDWLNLEP